MSEIMGNNMDQQKISDKVISSIKEGGVRMRPRWYFFLRDILGVTAIVIALLIAVYVASFVIFVLHVTGAWFVPVFGLSGWWSLFNALPWALVTLTTFFTVVLAILARRYAGGHQWPLLYSILAIGFIIAAASFIGVQSSFLKSFFASPTAESVPFLGQYYPGIGILAPNDIHRGQIIEIMPGGFLLKAISGPYLWVFVNSSTNFTSGLVPRVGDSVVVFGTASATSSVRAAGIEKLVN